MALDRKCITILFPRGIKSTREIVRLFHTCPSHLVLLGYILSVLLLLFVTSFLFNILHASSIVPPLRREHLNINSFTHVLKYIFSK